MNINGVFLSLWLLNSGCAALDAEEIKVTAGQAGESGLNQPKNKIDAKVLDRVRSKGVAPVMVDLNVPVKSEIRTREEEQSQVRAVRAVQDLVLQELIGTQYKLRYRFDLAPTMSMEVGADALAVLERSTYVVRVSEIGRGTNPREFIIIPEKQ